jgi:hypothetical protein
MLRARAMGEDDKGHLVIGRLLELAASCEDTMEEAEAELQAMGIDVEAFVARVKKRVEDAKADALRDQVDESVSTGLRLSRAADGFAKILRARKFPGITAVATRLSPMPTIIVHLRTSELLRNFRHGVPEVGTGHQGFHVVGMAGGSIRPAKA